MASITTRVGKGSPLTTQELDANFTNLNADKLEKSGESAAFADLTLSTVSATLHRSPNAITALFVYDTSKDSDPTWVDRCTHTSWYQETIYGKWLGAQASESAARAVTGATTDDYFQLTTDGKFYKLNATSGTTEVFRGNKRAFPKLAAIVAESTNVTIYDLTEVGRPMFCRFVAIATATITSKYLLSGANALAAINGKLYVGGTGTNLTGLTTIDFAKDMARLRTTSGYTWNGNLSTRNTVGGYTTVDAAVGGIVNATANAVATTVLPDAPVDPATGLKVPTIAVATAAGLSIIQNTGTVRNSSSTSAFTQVTLNPQLLSAGRADTTWYYATTPGGLGASFALSSVTSSAAPDFNVGNTTLLKAKDRSTLARTSSDVVQLLRNNEGTVTKGIAAKLSDTYNTGWLAGDIRRAYLSDVNAGSVTGPELVTNGTFDTDVSGWVTTGPAVLTVDEQRLKVTYSPLGSPQWAYQWVSVVVGKTYEFSFYADKGTSTGWQVRLGNTNAGQEYYSVTNGSVTGTNKRYFTPTANAVCISLFPQWTAGLYCLYDNISVKEVIPDRSYKAAASNIYGTLTSTAVNTGNSLVGYSGFSGSNYIQEPYSADLDFGTSEWSVGAWVNVPTANAAAGTIAARAYSSGAYITLGIDATNKLTATAYDGTTTRTVTTSAAYNTGTWLKADATYTTDGALKLWVNGVEVAAATGTPLLTLNNNNAVLTIGNSYALDAPFPGSIALLKFSATVPTAEQTQFMYAQEKHLFTAGAQCVLPASTSVLNLTYDDRTDTWSTLQAAYESSFNGLVRTSTQAPSAGAFSKSAAGSGIKLLARTTTNPGVDVQMPKRNLKDDPLTQPADESIVVFDFDAVTSQTDFALPMGYTAKVVYSAGAQKREGPTKDWTRRYDGFLETIRFGTAPGNGVWVQIHAVKEVV